MKASNIELNDFNTINESVDKTNIDRKPKIELCGEVLMEMSDGRSVFTKNKLLINGSTLALRKLFNVSSKYNFKTLNEIMGINASPVLPAKPVGFEDAPYLADSVCLFAVGTGGCGTGFQTVNPVKYNEVGVTDIIPFRYSNTPLDPAIEDKYALSKTEGGYTAYYGKKFEATPIIKCLNANGTEVPDNVEALAGDDISTFIELKLKIDKDDCREWFAIAGGGIEAARVNTLSLLMGFEVEISPGVFDHVELKVLTKYNMNNEALEEGKEIYITYRIYV